MKLLIPIFLLLSVSLGFAASEQAQSGFRFGERPKNSIFDPSGILTLKEQAELAEPLAKVRTNEGIDVIVVILLEIGDAPPDHVAKGFAEKWASTNVNAVVLHVPGQVDSPWIFPGHVMGSLLKPEALGESIAKAEKRAAAEPTDYRKVRAATIEASDALRYWMGGSVIRSEELINQRMAGRLAYESRRRLLKLAVVLFAAALIPMVVGIVLIFVRIRNSRPRRFPATRILTRLGAPYSGGNNAVSRSL